MTTNITLPRATVEQALEALEHHGGHLPWIAFVEVRKDLRAALAEPVQAKFDEVAVEQWKLRMVFYDENGEPLMSRQPEPDEIIAALAEPVQEPVALKWLPAPRKTEWGFGMVSADVEIDRDHTLTMYCEDDQTAKVDAMFRRVFCKEKA